MSRRWARGRDAPCVDGRQPTTPVAGCKKGKCRTPAVPSASGAAIRAPIIARGIRNAHANPKPLIPKIELTPRNRADLLAFPLS
ncbi:MAG TPA: hypothetical protein VKR61_08980 [Bryobacteraceae bacterium]|nr:hypothetical protein [Bryobacteraceae bacterium]